MEGYQSDEATYHTQEALAIVPDAWLSKEGLATVYGDQGRWSEATQLMEEAYSSLPENCGHLGAYLHPHIYDWNKAIGDTKAPMTLRTKALG